MENIQSISIPQPCHQSWQQMTAVEEGRHCQQCSKTVIDFTKMTDKEIISHLSATSNVCGRFGDNQINNINRTLITKDSKVGLKWKKFVLGISLLWAATVLKVEGQAKVAPNKNTEQHSKIEEGDIIGKIATPSPLIYKTITGRVIDINKQPIIGAVIRVASTSLITVTDAKGNFKLTVTEPVSQFTVGYIGFISKNVNITNESSYQVQLLESNKMTGEVVIVRTPVD